jgi:hypothetical protein
MIEFKMYQIAWLGMTQKHIYSSEIEHENADVVTFAL